MEYKRKKKIEINSNVACKADTLDITLPKSSGFTTLTLNNSKYYVMFEKIVIIVFYGIPDTCKIRSAEQSAAAHYKFSCVLTACDRSSFVP